MKRAFVFLPLLLIVPFALPVVRTSALYVVVGSPAALDVAPVIVAQAATLPVPPPFSASSSSVREYVRAAAVAAGVDPKEALYILKNESQDCGWERDGYFEPDIPGDAGASIGCWQIYLPAHNDVTPACAADFICSTEWSLRMIKNGYDNWWSTWRFRNCPDRIGGYLAPSCYK